MMTPKEVSAIVLAAGLSRRAQPRHKLLVEYGGKAVIRSTVEAICGAGCGEVLVVTGYMSDHVVAALRDLPVQFVHAEDYALGMGHSLAAGVRAAQKISGGFLITVGDLPRLSAVPVREVLAHFVSGDGRYHVVPTWRGQRGHPVVLGSWIRSGLESLTGDIGARSLLQTPEERQRIHFMETEDEAVVKDFDE